MFHSSCRCPFSWTPPRKYYSRPLFRQGGETFHLRTLCSLLNQYRRSRRFHPLSVLADEILQSIHGVRLGNIELHRGLADIKVHLPRRATHVSEVRIGHFSRTVHDATHDRDLHALEMRSRGFDSRRRRLEIKQRPAARWARDVIGFKNARAGGLENVIAQAQRLPRRFLALDENRVADSIAKQ